MKEINDEMKRTAWMLIALSIFSGLFWAAMGFGVYYAIKWLIYI